MVELKTAKEMYQYCVYNRLGTGTKKGRAIKHFQLLIDNLKAEEKVYCVFIGLHNYMGMTKHDGEYAYAFTDKRFIMAQHKLSGAKVQSVNIENINDISLSTKSGKGGVGIGTVCIDTFREAFNVGVNVTCAENIYRCVHETWDEIRIHETWDEIRMQRENKVPNANMSNTKTPVEQMKEYKELLDMGILTQEEFDTKKKELLGL